MNPEPSHSNSSSTCPNPRAPARREKRAKTIFQPTFNWRRLSVSSSIERNTLLGSGVKVRSLHDLSTNELLDGLKSLGCPLKARRCLLTVGINGKDFEIYSDRDLEQIGVNRKDIRERVLQIQKKIIDHGCKIPEALLAPRSKREIMTATGQDDPFKELSSSTNHNMALLRKADTYSGGLTHQSFAVDDNIVNRSPKNRNGTLTPAEKEEIVLDLRETMEEVATRLESMSVKKEVLDKVKAELQEDDLVEEKKEKADELMLPEISPSKSPTSSERK